ncbi:MAG TPA: DUF445 domain-containing protein [Burkholderiales bacterium]|nr:DUF445 domain-containing protein [Burkholderiales bacterium]
MKLLATGLLLLAGAVYVAARALEPGRPWLHYVAAAAEAAMIGAIADWFAVVALFHHPLNLSFIPHTAILPRNKARIAEGLSQFIQQNFLSSAAVVARIAAFRPAETLCRWLVRRENAETLAAYATRLVSYALTAVDDERVRGFLARVVTDALGRADVATALAQLLDVLTENERHHALLDEALAGLDELLAREATRRFIAEEVRKSSPVLLRAINQMLGLKLDERAALKIVDVALKKVSEVRRDREHELRERFDAFVRRFIERLKSDPAMREKIHRMRDEALDNPALAGYVGGLWDEFRAWLPGGMRGRLPGLIVELGEKIDADPAIREWIDEQILSALPPLVEEHRAKFGRFIEDQILSWQEEKLVAELERHIGPDLQYIRINGTVVGALAGLAIAALTQLLP